VVYGPERTGITKYNRSQYSSVFVIDHCENAEQAWNAVDCGWPGYPPDLDIYCIMADGTEKLN
jgi:hypothetical protein